MPKHRKTGCPDCDKLPYPEICLKHQLEEADYQVAYWMQKVEELKKKKEKTNEPNSKTGAVI